MWLVPQVAELTLMLSVSERQLQVPDTSIASACLTSSS